VAINRIFSRSTQNGPSEAAMPLVANNRMPAQPAMVCVPVAPTHAQWQQQVYQLAVQWARMAIAPPRHEQLLAASYN
jgi:hypothetical protein